ncbi:MAG: hypothetical protein ACYDEY_16440, partial [Acidimicrobiales bacterium]
MSTAATSDPGTPDRRISPAPEKTSIAWLLSRPRPLLLSAYAIIGAALVGAAIALKPIYGLGL